MSTKTTKQIPVDRLLQEPEHDETSDALSEKNKIYRWTREAADKRAKEGIYNSVGTYKYEEDAKTGKKHQTTKPNRLRRNLRTAYAKVWYPVDNTQKQKDHISHSKLGTGVRFLSSIKLADFQKSFPTVFRAPKDKDVDPNTTELNIYLAAQRADLIKALRLHGVLPAAISNAQAEEFVDAHSLYPDVLREFEDDEETPNPKYDPERHSAYKAIVKESDEKHGATVAQAVLDEAEVTFFIMIGKAIGNDPYTKSNNVRVLDVNGVVVCLVGEKPEKNITNVVTDKLDAKTPEQLERMFSDKTGTKNLNISKLLPDRPGAVFFKDRPNTKKNAAKATKAGAAKQFNLAFTFRDKDGKVHPVRSDFIWSNSKLAVKTFIGEMSAAVRDDGRKVFGFNEEAAAGALAAFEQQLVKSTNKAEKVHKVKTVKDSGLFTTNTKHKEKEEEVEESE
jgi:hypothetical protein